MPRKFQSGAFLFWSRHPGSYRKNDRMHAVVLPWMVLELCSVLALTQLGIRQSDWRRAGIMPTNLHIVVEYVTHAHCIVLVYFVGNKITTRSSFCGKRPHAWRLHGVNNPYFSSLARTPQGSVHTACPSPRASSMTSASPSMRPETATVSSPWVPNTNVQSLLCMTWWASWCWTKMTDIWQTMYWNHWLLKVQISIG